MAGRPWDARASKDTPEISSIKSLEEPPLDSACLFPGNNKKVLHTQTLSSAPSTAAFKSLKQPPYFQSPSTPQSCKPVTSSARSSSPRSTSRNLADDGNALSTGRSTPSLVSAPQRFSSKHSIASSSVRDDESLISFPAVPSYMASTQSAKAKVRSHSTPKQRPGTPEKEPLSSVKKRLSFPQSETFVGASGPLKSIKPPGPQRSPSLRGHSGPLKLDRSFHEISIDSIASLNSEMRRQYK